MNGTVRIRCTADDETQHRRKGKSRRENPEAMFLCGLSPLSRCPRLNFLVWPLPHPPTTPLPATTGTGPGAAMGDG
jgi:hypothetical protein